MAIAEVGELFVDLDERVEKCEGETEKGLVAIEHDEKRRAQGGRPKNSAAGFEKDVVELAEQIGFVIALRKALFVERAIAFPEWRAPFVWRVPPIPPEILPGKTPPPLPVLHPFPSAPPPVH